MLHSGIIGNEGLTVNAKNLGTVKTYGAYDHYTQVWIQLPKKDGEIPHNPASHPYLSDNNSRIWYSRCNVSRTALMFYT